MPVVASATLHALRFSNGALPRSSLAHIDPAIKRDLCASLSAIPHEISHKQTLSLVTWSQSSTHGRFVIYTFTPTTYEADWMVGIIAAMQIYWETPRHRACRRSSR
jgi:hypothetical protein